jgi:hypothetical protein
MGFSAEKTGIQFIDSRGNTRTELSISKSGKHTLVFLDRDGKPI